MYSILGGFNGKYYVIDSGSTNIYDKYKVDMNIVLPLNMLESNRIIRLMDNREELDKYMDEVLKKYNRQYVK